MAGPSGRGSSQTSGYTAVTANDIELESRASADVSKREKDHHVGMTDAGFRESTGPVSDVPEGLSQWGESRVYKGDDEDEQRSENALLLDPEDPDASPLADDEFAMDKEDEEDSPYPEVRAAVRNYDEDEPCNTVRAWTLGLILVVMGASMNTFFSLRAPSIAISPLVAQIISWPAGHAWAKLAPTREWNTFGMRWTLNPGPFNRKEHTIIVVMASVSFSVAYATDIILAQLVFYKQDFGYVFQLLLTISTQSLGYGIAGILRKFLVYPASMIWPGILVSVTLMNAMYDRNDRPDPTIIGGRMPRYHWFGYITLCAFGYYWIPGFFVKCLSVFAFATWMAPNNVIVNQVFGGSTGLSLFPITFDWTQIAGYIGSPLIPPWEAIANTMIGVVTFYLIGCSFFHYTGVWYSQYLPMSDSGTYDNTGKPYNTTRVLTPDMTLDEEAYNNYSPLFISTTFAMSYGLSFAAISSLIVYTYLHNGKQIWQQYKNSSKEKADIHMKLMAKYREAPIWWYWGLFAVVLALGFFAVLWYPTKMTWWAFLLSVIISFTFSVPIGIIQAVTNHQIGLNVMTEFIYGYIQPGRPLALMIFKTFGYITMSRALSFVADLKFGHYMKIPPRTMFWAQVVATTVSCVVQIIVLNTALSSVDGVCTPEQVDRFTCPGARVFFAASVIWGLLGPARMFSPGQIYSGLFVFFGIGAVTPVIIYFAMKRWPRSPLKFLMAPLIFGGGSAIPPATPLNYLSWGTVGLTFNYWIRKRHFGWWSRLNFLTSSALDLGLALSTLVIFFAVMHGLEAPQWWGNDIVKTTLDYKNEAVQQRMPEGQTFGPSSW